jgi:opacity protein-like surface antigen
MNYRFFSVTSFVLTISCPAFAADAPVFKATAPPAPAPLWNWSSCYVGVNAGLSAARSRESATTPAYTNGDNFNFPNGFSGGVANPEVSNGNSFLGGGHVGCRYQTPQRFVFGLEGDFNFTNLRLTHVLGPTNISAPFLPGDTFSTRTNWQSSIRGNIGYSWDRWLAYLTGGVAVARMHKDATYLAGNGGGPVTFLSASGSDEKTLVGLTVGAGAAYAIDKHWTIGAEYRYTNYGSKNFKLGTITSDSTDPATRVVVGVNGKADLQTHEIMAKINYGFDWFKSERDERPLRAFASVGPAPDVPRFYGSVDYLLWQVKGAPLSVPLVTTGPIATTHHGLIGAPAENGADSTILYGAPLAPAKGGNDTQKFPLFSGSRLVVGYWFDDTKRIAMEVSGFGVQSRSAGFSARSDSSGNPILGFSVYNNVPYSIGPMTIFAGEDSLPTSLPDDPNRARANGVIIGGINIRNTLKLWGLDVSGVFNLHRSSSWELSGLAGLRYLNLSEDISLVGDIHGISGPYTGQSGVVWDQFETKNHFYGALLGMRGRWFWGPVSLDLTTSVAVGSSNETITISGGFTSVNFALGSGPNGVFAQPANEGTYSGNKFAFVPEVHAKLGYDLTSSIRVTVGYDFLYYSNVVRPGDQINREIPKGQTFQQARTPDSLTSPARLFNTTDFYAQGLSLGVSARF